MIEMRACITIDICQICPIFFLGVRMDLLDDALGDPDFPTNDAHLDDDDVGEPCDFWFCNSFDLDKKQMALEE